MSAGNAGRIEGGDQAAQDGQFDRAEKLYAQADEAGDGAASGKLGVLREHRGDVDGALAAFRRADERGDGFGTLRLGLLLAGLNQWKEAEAAFARADERGSDPAGLDLIELLAQRDRGARSAPTVGAPSALANPVLVGAMTVLVALVAVFLAYNANEGLPFVPTKELKVNFASGADIVVGDAVNEGGYRVGLVSDERPIKLRSGQIGAQLTLQLNQSHGQVPTDSTAEVRPRSVLGLKVIDLHTGASHRTFADGGTMPITQTSVPVQFEDLNLAFNQPTRKAVDQNLVGFGNTLAGRGSSLNDTFASLPRLLGYLRPVAAYLSDPRTQLTRFLRSLEGFMGAVSPVAQTNARLFTDMATTFAAIGHSPSDLENTIRLSPSTEAVSTQSLKVQQPFLVDLATLGTHLAPATAELRAALPEINPAIEIGTKTLARTPSLNANLQQVMTALDNLSRAPGTNVAINALTGTVSTLNPMVRYLGPYQTVCDYWNYFWTYLGDVFSEQTSFGFAQRALIDNANSAQPNNIGQQGATAPVNGGGSDSAQTGGNEFFHSQSYGAAVATTGAADCETGQRGDPKKLNYADPQGRNFGTDVHTPGLQGPTFAGRTHVPAGETFSRSPTTGPLPGSVPGNN
jgi:ABC-type transporter Mla subunit MlaD